MHLSSSRAVGYRFGPHLGDSVPVLINYCTSASENDEELREYSLQVLSVSLSGHSLFESFILFLLLIAACLVMFFFNFFLLWLFSYLLSFNCRH